MSMTDAMATTRWEVEWCSKVATVPGTTDVDFDRCEFSVEVFPTQEAAVAFAVAKWPTTTDKLGIVQIFPQEYRRHRDGTYRWAEWEQCGDTLIVSNASGNVERN
jgi:hypothetical protein